MIKPIKKFENIPNIRKRYNNEWLLIRVDKAEGATPLTGRLIDHNQDRSVIFKAIRKYNKKYPVYAVYSEDKLPKGYAAAFHTIHV